MATKNKVETIWERVNIGAQFLIGSRIVGHVWQGADGGWRGATVKDGTFFGPFQKEADAREAVSTTALELEAKKRAKREKMIA